MIAGPNGSGKTSVTSKILHHEWLEDSEYINPDNVARDVFGDWNNQEFVLSYHVTTNPSRTVSLWLHLSTDFMSMTTRLRMPRPVSFFAWLRAPLPSAISKIFPIGHCLSYLNNNRQKRCSLLKLSCSHEYQNGIIPNLHSHLISALSVNHQYLMH